jgi:hypothetical protein
VLTTEHKPLGVQIDPDFNTLRKLLPGESPPIFRDVTLSQGTVLVVATQDHGFAVTAYRLAERLLQRVPELGDGDLQAPKTVPVLAVGSTRDIATLRARMGRFSHEVEASDRVTQKGTARAWTERSSDGKPWLFIAADDAAALAAILRPLPHYRRRSFVAFEGAKSIEQGLWQSRASPLTRRFGD